MKGFVSRLAIGGGVVAAVATLVAIPAAAAPAPLAAPMVSVANPSPGAYLRRGQNWIAGVACDPNAPTSDTTAGIAKVSAFTGDRDHPVNVPSFTRGGYMGGAATLAGTNQEFSFNSGEFSRLGIGTPDTSVCKHPLAAWRLLPGSFRKGVWDLNIYVLGKNGMETRVTIAGLRIDHP